MAKTRLEELEKLSENFITSKQELEKLKLEVISAILSKVQFHHLNVISLVEKNNGKKLL